MTIQAIATGIIAPIGFFAGCYKLGQYSVSRDVRLTLKEQGQLIKTLSEIPNPDEDTTQLIKELRQSSEDIKNHFNT
jgi:hypothetical protein